MYNLYNIYIENVCIYINVYVYNILGNEEWKLNMQFCKKLYRYNNSSPLLPMMTEKYEYLPNS